MTVLANVLFASKVREKVDRYICLREKLTSLFVEDVDGNVVFTVLKTFFLLENLAAIKELSINFIFSK